MNSEPDRAYVWAWLPGAVEPVVAGVLEADGALVVFTYGRSYLERPDAVPLYLPELPLEPGRQRPPGGLRVAGVIQDAGPDSWGQRVLMHRLVGRARRGDDPAELGPLTYLLESASDRTGALDFQTGPDEYVPRDSAGTLEELLTAAGRFEPVSPSRPNWTPPSLAARRWGERVPKRPWWTTAAGSSWPSSRRSMITTRWSRPRAWRWSWHVGSGFTSPTRWCWSASDATSSLPSALTGPLSPASGG